MSPEDDARLIATQAAQDLTATMRDMIDRLDRAERQEKLDREQIEGNRRLFWHLFWGAIALILAVGVGLAIWIGLEASARESANRAQEAARIYGNCITGNQVRAADLAFEELFIPDVLAGQPDAKKEAARLLAIVRAKDAQRQCTLAGA